MNSTLLSTTPKNAQAGGPAPLEKWRCERWATAGISILIVYTVLRNVLAAAAKPLWYDELCTLIVARQPSLPAIWSVLKDHVDSQPPTFYLVERAAGALLLIRMLRFACPRFSASSAFCFVYSSL